MRKEILIFLYEHFCVKKTFITSSVDNGEIAIQNYGVIRLIVNQIVRFIVKN